MWYIAQSLVAIDYDAITLRWEPTPALDLDGYFVYMREGEIGDFVQMNEQPLLLTEWDSPPLRKDLKYYFYVKAKDTSDNLSLPSSILEYQLSEAVTIPPVLYIPASSTVVLHEATTYEEILTFDSSNFMTRMTLGGNV